MSELDYDRWGRWVYATCLMFGTSPQLAHEIAAIFLRHVQRERDAAPAAAKEGT
jgi:hypothetical protein